MRTPLDLEELERKNGSTFVSQAEVSALILLVKELEAECQMSMVTIAAERKRAEIAEAALAKARDEALEEAARLAEDMSTERLENPHEIWLHGFNVAQTAIGKAIRALKSRTPT